MKETYLSVIKKHQAEMKKAALLCGHNWTDTFYIGNNADGSPAWSYGSPGIMKNVRSASADEVVSQFGDGWQKRGLSPEALQARL